MKTSNKILLGTFLTALLILISVHIALYAKIKRGEYTLLSDEWHPNLAAFSLDHINHVSLNNIENVTIHFADSSKLQYDKPAEDEENVLSLLKKNDTLFVIGKSNRSNIGRWYRTANLYLSRDIGVSAVNTNLHLSRDHKNAAIHSLNLRLDRALIDINGQGRGSVLLDSLFIQSVNKSTALLNDVRIAALDMVLRDTYVEGNNLTAGSINIATDSASQIKLSAQNLLKAKLTAHE